MHKELSTPHATAGHLLFDWQLDVQRLEREADDAAAAGVPDPWAMVEAECSLDLIDAELAALAKLDSRQTADTVAHLKRWRARTERVIERLGELAAVNSV